MPPGGIHGSRPCAVTPLDPELIQVGNGPPGTKRGTELMARRAASAQVALVIGTHRSGAGLRFLSRD
jgi:hypothetical protein